MQANILWGVLLLGISAFVWWQRDAMFSGMRALKPVIGIMLAVGVAWCAVGVALWAGIGTTTGGDDGTATINPTNNDATFSITGTIPAARTAESGSGTAYNMRIASFNTTSGAFATAYANGASGEILLNFSVSRTDMGIESAVCQVSIENIGSYTRTTGATAGVTYSAIGTTAGGLTNYQFNSTYGATAVVSKTGTSIQLRFPSTTTSSTQYVLADLHINSAYMDAIADDGLITYAHIADIVIDGTTFEVSATLVSTVV